ncbi:hypothetical protein [Ruegeria arenilitoris]|uniref:hypothetical protein n=1 Tax=Ruegeria arenilitoris TaxID=1173585 RepID=UPI001580A8EE|nr:hypothetical protein [Ruegeria arenilitoris]
MIRPVACLRSGFPATRAVTSAVHPDLTNGVGNVLTIIDLNTPEPIKKHHSREGKAAELPVLSG